MAEPIFLLQIIHAPTGEVISRFPAGGYLESKLIEDCVEAILKKGVGVFRTSAHVEEDIRAGIAETIWALKDQTRFIV